MHKLRQIFAFVAPYVKPYWGRIVAGVFFGILFGVSNGLALWTTKIMLDRLSAGERLIGPDKRSRRAGWQLVCREHRLRSIQHPRDPRPVAARRWAIR